MQSVYCAVVHKCSENNNSIIIINNNDDNNNNNNTICYLYFSNPNGEILKFFSTHDK